MKTMQVEVVSAEHEIFSGEDEHFKNKISDKIVSTRKQRKTILLVSHNLDFIKNNCAHLSAGFRGCC